MKFVLIAKKLMSFLLFLAKELNDISIKPIQEYFLQVECAQFYHMEVVYYNF